MVARATHALANGRRSSPFRRLIWRLTTMKPCLTWRHWKHTNVLFPGGTTCVWWRDSSTTVNFFPLLPFFSLFSYQCVKVFSHLFFISSLVLIFFIAIYFVFYIFFWLIFFIQLYPSSFCFIWFLYQIWSLFFLFS